MHKHQQENQTLVTHPRTGELIDIEGLWEFIDRMSSGNESLKDDIDDMKHWLSESSRRIFESHEPEKIDDFKDDIKVFLYLGDFIQSIKVFTEAKTEG